MNLTDTDRRAALGARKTELAASIAALRTAARDLEDRLADATERMQQADRELHERLVVLERRSVRPPATPATPAAPRSAPWLPSESGPGEQPPSRLMLAIAGAAAAVLIVVTVIVAIVVSSSGPGSPRSAAASVDACALVTPQEATAALGTDAGPAHSVLNSCIYESGPQRLLVAAVRQDAAAQFDAAAGSLAKAVPGLGDRAFYRDGRLGALKGTKMILVTITPSSQDTPSAQEIAVTKMALGRL